MKVYVSADIEGVTGITDWDEADRTKPDYAWFRDRMAAEVRAACEGAREGGATEIWVKDAHATGRNLNPGDLPAGTRLIRGWSGHPLSMVQELDRSFDALAFVGYHSPATGGGNALSHTMSGRFGRIEVDGAVLSEFRLHALAGRMLGVPTVFLAGDEALCALSAAEEPGLVTVPTGRGVGHSMIGFDPRDVLEAIRSGMAEAVRGARQRDLPPMPSRFVVEIRYRRTADAYKASFYPGMEALLDDTVRLVTTDWFEVMRALKFV